LIKIELNPVAVLHKMSWSIEAHTIYFISQLTTFKKTGLTKKETYFLNDLLMDEQFPSKQV
jgi:hypothetical protein